MTEKSAFTFHPRLDGKSLQDYYAGNLDYASDMFHAFLTYGPEVADCLDRQLRDGDWQGVASTLHKFQPSLAMVGLRELALQAGRLKDLVEAEADRPGATRRIGDLLSAFTHQLPIIREEFHRLQRVLSN